MRWKVLWGMVLVLLSGYSTVWGQGESEREFGCLVVSRANPETEAGKLVFQRMDLEPALGCCAPASFSLAQGHFDRDSPTVFQYQAGPARLLAWFGKVGLYRVDVRMRSRLPRKIARRIEVTIPVEDLLAFGDTIQPVQRALDVAARKLGKPTGFIWVMSLERLQDGRIKALVGFSNSL